MAQAVSLALTLTAVLYLYDLRTVRRDIAGWRAGAFLAGLGLIWIGYSARLTALTHRYLTAHMAQHLLLMLLAPPLLLLGSPVLVFKRGRIARSKLRPWLAAAGRGLTHPLAAGLLMVMVTIAWHVPVVFELGMRSHGWNAFEDATFLASGILFWWPVILPWPSRSQWPRSAIPLYLLGSDLPVSVLSAYLAFCGHAIYPAYRLAPGLFEISPLNDQVFAAMLMWVAMLVVFLGAAVAVIVDMLERW